MPETLHLPSNDCPNCHGVGYLGLSYTDDLQSGNYTPPLCHWCNSSSTAKPTTGKWTSNQSSTTPSSLTSCYNQLNSGVPEGWNMVLPLARSNLSPYPIHENRSFPSSPGSATDLSPSTYSEAKGYFDFIPIQKGTQYEQSAPISPSSLSVPGSDNDHLDTPPLLSPGGGCSRTQNQRDSKARCLKKLDNAMEKLIGLLPSEMQLSCKRGRANGLKLVEEYIMRIITENNQLRLEGRKTSIENDRVVTENHKLREEIARLKMQVKQYR